MVKTDYNRVLNEINSLKKGEIIFVSGKFNTLHPGHIRLLKFAKELGGSLVVALEPDDADETLLPGNLRIEAINSTSYVDYALILNSTIDDFINQLKPNIIVKGNEFEDKFNSEKEILDSYGGKLVLGSGDIRFSSLDLLKREFSSAKFSSINKPTDFPKRHKFNSTSLIKIIKKFPSLNVMVIGDTIVDEYITCDPLGMSQEDPTIAVAPISSTKFLGGAGIVAAHAKGLGANVISYTIAGHDYDAKFVEAKLKNYSINNPHLYCDKSRPTTLKQRFRAKGKTLLRVNHLKQHHIDNDIQDKIYKNIESDLKETDLIVFSDFSYGCLPQNLVDRIVSLGSKEKIMMIADSQSSSQIGDVSRFKNMALITPTEKEARLAVGDFESGLIALTEKLIKKSNPKNIILTLAAEGILINTSDKNQKVLTTDQLPAMNPSPKDVAGGGDSFLICSSLALGVGANIWEAAYLGSLAAAVQVGRIGNIPLTSKEIIKEINT